MVLSAAALGSLVLGAIAVPPAGAQPAGTATYRSAPHGFAFQYPDRFAVGAYRTQGADVLFKDAVVFVERARLGRHRVDEIPVGELTSITVFPQTGHRARFLLNQFYRDPYRAVIGGRPIAKLPGYPGPYGDTAFYYLMPLSDTLVVELYAHRRYLEPPGGDTGYDQVIESIITSITVSP